MNDDAGELLAIATMFADPSRRRDAARMLATAVGSEDLVLFVKDEGVAAFLPAPGFPKTLPRGRAWQDVVARATELPATIVTGELPYPDAITMRPCHAVHLDDSVVVLLGGAPTPDAIAKLRTIVFVLAAISKNEVRAIAADASATDARGSATQAESLARTLAATHEELQSVLAELRQSQEWLSTTLRSIGDAVMTTDAAGNITFLNPQAEEITGWSDADARGRPVAEVFHVVNETTRARVDCPVARVLRERTVVGLANHTLLVRKDRTELPIDDSAAPIYDRSGDLAGTVLVFRDVTERKRAQAKLDASVRRSQLVAAIGSALTNREPLTRQLDACMSAIVSHLGAAFARAWTIDESAHVLELRASAGLYTHLDGPHARVPVGRFKIGRIAAVKKPHLTNDVAGDPHVSDAAWALREGMVAFAGYPLLVGDRVVGVIALFSRSTLAPETLDVLAAIADAIAVAVDRARREDDLARSAEQLRGLTAASLLVGSRVSVEDVLQSLADSARDLIGAHQSVTSLTVGDDWVQAITAVSLSDKYAAWKAYAEKPDGSGIYALVCETNSPMRMTQAELAAHPRFRGFGKHAEKHPPMRGWLAVPLVNREGKSIGLLQLSDKVLGEFTEQDEAILVQLARFASVALDNAGLIARASHAARAREQMLAIVSHDLRNPLGTIIVAANFIDEAAHSDEAAVRERLARYSGMVRRAAERMTKLVGDLLDFGSIESGRLTLEKKPVDGYALAREAYEAHEAIAVANEVSLSISVPDGEATIDADRDRLAQVFANLVGNALKFTPRAGRVDIRAERHEDTVVFSIADTGPGVSEEVLPCIFDPYRQAKPTPGKGVGLGLFIAKAIVEAHGGRLSLESVSGHGTKFFFDVPCTRPASSH